MSFWHELRPTVSLRKLTEIAFVVVRSQHCVELVQWSDKYDPKITRNCLKRAKIGRKLITWEKIMLNSHSIIVILNNVENYLYAGFAILKLLNLSSNF